MSYAATVDGDAALGSKEHILLVYARQHNENFLSGLTEKVCGRSKRILLDKLAEEQEKHGIANKELRDTQETLAQLQEAKKKLDSDYASAQYLLTECGTEREELMEQLRYFAAVLEQNKETIRTLSGLCGQNSSAKLMRFDHFLRRFKAQLLLGGRDGRKKFRTWFRGRKSTDVDGAEEARYNPWKAFGRILEEMDMAQSHAKLRVDNAKLRMGHAQEDKAEEK